MSDCTRTRDLMGPHLYDDLSEAARRAVESHLHACEACRRDMEALRAITERVPADLLSPPAGVEPRVLRGVQARLVRRRPRWAWAPAAVAAAAVVVLVICRPPHSRSPQPVPVATRQAGLPPAPPQEAPAPAPRGRANATRPHPASAPRAHPPSPTRPVAREPVEVAHAEAPPLAAPHPIGLDDVTTTHEPPELD